jgi:hypothetical protein
MEYHTRKEYFDFASEEIAHQLYDGKGQKYYTRISDGLMIFFPPNVTLLLSKLIDLSSLWQNKNRWFYCKQPLLLFWTGLTISQYRTARNQLCEYNLIERKVSGSPPKEYFKINLNLLHITAQTGFELLSELKKDELLLDDLIKERDQFLRSLLLGNLRINSQETSKLIIRKPENSIIINNNTNNTKEIKLNNKTKDNIVEGSKRTSTDRNKTYIPIAELLAMIIQQKKNIKVDKRKLNTWSNSIRQLVERDGVESRRIRIALRWYKHHWGDDFVPVIESGQSLRDKFLRLESAIERSKSTPVNSKTTGFQGKQTLKYKKSIPV